MTVSTFKDFYLYIKEKEDFVKANWEDQDLDVLSKAIKNLCKPDF